MELLHLSNNPPDMPALTIHELKQWEHGNLMLSPEQVVSALRLQRTLIESSVELQLVSAV